MASFDAVFMPNCIMMVGGAPNVNSEKLFVRWLPGETDGQGEGYRPFLQQGAWSVRIVYFKGKSDNV